MAQNDSNEAPICNLSKITEYITKFMDLYSPMLGANFLSEEKFSRLFFSSYLYTILPMGEGEFEDEDNPFPKGNIPFSHRSPILRDWSSLYCVSLSIKNGRQSKYCWNYDKESKASRRRATGQDKSVRYNEDVLCVGLSRAEKLMIIPTLGAKGACIEVS